MARVSNELRGLTTHEAELKLREYGANVIPEERRHPLVLLLGKFWAPVPWMLEATIVLELVTHKVDEAIIISVLLLFNSLLGFVEENQANNALTLLRSRLAVEARVLRDGRWQLVPAQQLVPGDVVHLRMGDAAAADVRLVEGELLMDESDLTGESLPVERGPRATAYAGARIKRGEATGVVTATGPHTYFGKTAELVHSAKTKSHLESVIFRIVKYLVALDLLLVVALIVYSAVQGLPMAETVPFALILLVASVPVALPATFTVATALGALRLAKRGVLVTRLSAIEEAATMDVLCCDKTGTITENRLGLAEIRSFPPYSEEETLRLAALASDDATQDPIDLAILSAARARGLLAEAPSRLQFIPFDPATKRSEAVFGKEHRNLRVLKGAPHVVSPLATSPPELNASVEEMASTGYRILAVAAGEDGALHLAGLVGLEDRPREDSKRVIQNLQELGVRVVMVTGDNAATGRAVARLVGIGERVCSAEIFRSDTQEPVADYDVFAGVFPEDKFHLVAKLQRAGHVAGMTGDGVNDAPALQQAEVGIAVTSATDVAKAAASMVLTQPGLAGVLDAVDTGRRIYQRMLTYTLNKIIKTLEIAVFLSLGVMLTGTFVITPLLIVLLLFTNDFVTMSLATDRVPFSRQPERWRIGRLLATACPLAGLILLLSFTIFFVGRDRLHLPLAELQTLIFVMLVFSGQGTVYLVRERRHFWSSKPSRWLLLSSFLDVTVVSALATRGVLMAPIHIELVGELFAIVAIFLIAVDFLKIRIFRYLRVR